MTLSVLEREGRRRQERDSAVLDSVPKHWISLTCSEMYTRACVKSDQFAVRWRITDSHALLAPAVLSLSSASYSMSLCG